MKPSRIFTKSFVFISNSPLEVFIDCIANKKHPGAVWRWMRSGSYSESIQDFSAGDVGQVVAH